MAVLRWDPWGEFGSAAARRQPVARQHAGDPHGRVGSADRRVPHRTDEGLVVRVELAGLRPDDVEVSVNDGMLTISGERKLDADIAEDAWVRRETAAGLLRA